MKKLILILSLTLNLVSCQKETLQSYMIDHKKNKNFIAMDFSLQTFVNNFEELSTEQKQLLKDVNKINFLAFKRDQLNEVAFQEKKAQLKKILKNDFEDNSLMSLNMNGVQVKMFAEDTDSNVEEIVLYANRNEYGFAIVRLLGEDLKPSNFYKLLKISKEMDISALESMLNR